MAPSVITKVTRNLAANCSVEASTCKSPERSAANVVDGNHATRWTSLYEDGQWITIDLGNVYPIFEVKIRWEMACAESYLVQGSTDGSSFTNLAQENGHEGWVVTHLREGCQARWVRMFGQTRATSFGFSIWEMQVVGGEAGSGGPPSSITKAALGRPGQPIQQAPGTSSSWWEVVHERVAVRAGPSTKAKMLSASKKGEGFRGTRILIEGEPWLRLDEGWVEECRTDIPVPKDVQGLWVLIDGKSVGLGTLLRPGVEPAETASKGRGPPKAKAKAAEAPQQLKPLMSTSEKPKAPTPQPYMPEGEWIVAHEKVVERMEPNVNAKAKRVREGGELVQGIPCYVGSNPWLKLDAGTWMLMDGRSAGVPGKLLVPAADIASDIMRWAEQHKNSEAGKDIVWNAQTDEELKRIEEVAVKQVDMLRPMLDFPQVLQSIEKEGFIQGDDFTLGPEGVAKAVRRILLRRRAGVLVLGEERKDSDRLPWSEEDFPKYLAKIIPDAPFFCRTFVPDDAPTRLLILLHGSLVSGDDLVGEAETLRKLMPETAVVLPEAPVLASKELGLRVWWVPPADAPKDISGIRDARDHGLLKAPPEAISRIVATVKWAHSRFKGIPFVLGGFSQGSMLAVQSLMALKAENLQPHGVLILSGLVSHFDLPPKVAALAIHGDQDERIEVDLPREVAQHEKLKKLKLEEIRGMGHEISDAVVDRVVRFCDEAAPVVRALATVEESDWVQEVNQAKLLRWVKKVSQVITMFDDERFMSHIVHLNMLGLGSDCPGLGNGPLFRYLVHDAGPDSRGHVVLFHGKTYDLRRETRHLVEAYKRLKLSVCVVDYRQKFSQFCVDATIVLESLGEITGSETSPIIIHSIGCGAIAGLHMAIASQAYSSSLRRRLRLLVLDGAVGNFRSLPPSPTGCIATDPIGNDEKLKYIGMPLVMLGGDDHCCGLKWTPGHWTVLGRAAEVLRDDGKLPALTMNTGLALMPSATESRLCPDLYRACESALDSVQRSNESAQKFAEDVLSSADITDQSEYRKFKDEDLRTILQKVVADMEQPENKFKLWSVRGEREPKRGQELTRLIASIHQPHLEAHGGFREGLLPGFQQFEGAVATLGELNPVLKKGRERVREAFDLRKLDEQVEQLLADKGRSFGITIAQCHGIMDSAIAEWNSQALFDSLVEKVREEGGNAARARQAVRERSDAMNIERAKQLGLEGSDDEVNWKLGSVFQLYQQVDPTLPIKMHQIQEGVMKCATKMHDMFKPAPAPKALKAAKEDPVVDVEVCVEHALEGGSISVTVKSTATMMDVRRAVMAALGETKLSQVKLVLRMNKDSGFQGLSDDQKLGEKRHVLMMGRSLGAPPVEESQEQVVDEDVELVIHVDRELGLTSRVRLPRSATIQAVKVQLAQEDAALDLAHIALKPLGSADSDTLPDDRPIEGIGALELCTAKPAPEVIEAAGDLELVVHIDRALGLESAMTLRPGSRIYTVKEQLAQADPTGSTKPEDFGLKLPGASNLLEDSVLITAVMTELDVCLPG